MVVSVVVDLWKMLVLRLVGFLVIDRSKKLTFLDSRVGLSRMLLWIVSMYCSMLSELVHVEP